MDALIIAAAADEKERFIDRHFGDAEYYYVYKLTPRNAAFIKRIKNTSEKERMHGDPAKAQSVAGILEQENVQVAVSKVFGSNIRRMRQKFVCVIAGEGTVGEKLGSLTKQFPLLVKEWESGEKRAVVSLKDTV